MYGIIPPRGGQFVRCKVFCCDYHWLLYLYFS
nr:MAG TPA: hypothetical protein [Caudoviricetes sp.]